MFKRGARRSGINSDSTGGGLTGVAVGVCGPEGLAREVKAAVRSVDPKRRKAVGGIEVHEEYVVFFSRDRFFSLYCLCIRSDWGLQDFRLLAQMIPRS